MATAMIGLGTVISVDEDDSGSTFTAVTLCVSATPPGRERALIDKTALDSTLSTYAAGREMHSEFAFTQFWEPEDTVHTSLDTLFGSKAEVKYTITYSNTSTTDTFEGFVSKLAPQTIEIDGMLTREVTIQRTTAITRT